MWKKVVHLEIDENAIPTLDKATLKTFSQTSDRFYHRKNTQGRHLVNRPRSIKTPFSQTESHFNKNTSWLGEKQKGATQANFRKTSKSVDSGNLIGRLALGSHGFGFHSERYGSKKPESAQRNIYKKI